MTDKEADLQEFCHSLTLVNVEGSAVFVLYVVNILRFTFNWRITQCVVLLSLLNGIRKNLASKDVFKRKQEFTLWFTNLSIKLVVKRGYFW